VFGAADDANGNGAFTYPSGRGTKAIWGGGIQVGAYYIASDQWRLGAAITSPDWMQPFKFNAEDERGAPLTREFHLDLPMIVSLGASWAPQDRLVIALDTRYFDYKNTQGFRERGFGPDGALLGLGWTSVVAVATGAQYRVTDRLYARGGYTYNDSPIPDSQTSTNVGAPLFYQHQVSTGASIGLSERCWLNAAYSYWPTTEISGPLVTPAGAIPGAVVTLRESVHIASLGVTVNY
jgi:long-chain fatty acid transport protein